MTEFTDLSQLKEPFCRVKAVFANRDNEDGDAPDWGDTKIVTLAVKRRAKAVKQGKETYPAGEIISMTIEEFGWAEYSEEDYESEFHEFLVEEYRMKILEVE